MPRTPRLPLALGALCLLATACAAPAVDTATPSDRSWEEVLAAAEGQTVDLWMWGGDERGNAFPAETPAARDLPNCVPIASQLTQAAGIATKAKLDHAKAAVLATCGDGATSRGDFHEALNVAGVWQLPLVVMVNNNQWAISVPRSLQTASDTIAQKAVAAGIEGFQVDGNDLPALLEALDYALKKARHGKGATHGRVARCDHRGAADISQSQPTSFLRWAVGAYGVATESATQGGHGSHRRRIALSGGEPSEQCGGNDGGRDSMTEGFFDRPAAFTGVLHIPRHPGELVFVGHRVDKKIEKPRPHDGAPRPGSQHCGYIGDQLLGGEKLEAFGIGLHQAVLDAVVHHLGVVSCPEGPGMDERVGALTVRTQRLEDRHQVRDIGRVAADHERIPVGFPPHPSGDPTVHQSDVRVGKDLGMDSVLDESGIAAVDDPISSGQHPGKLADHLSGRCAGGNHHPYRARDGQRLNESLQGGDITGGGVRIEPDYVVAALTQAPKHARTHPTQAHKSQLHRYSSSLRARTSGLDRHGPGPTTGAPLCPGS